jgi:hypothetical protein
VAGPTGAYYGVQIGSTVGGVVSEGLFGTKEQDSGIGVIEKAYLWNQRNRIIGL